MRTYSGRILKSGIRNIQEQGVETRDAVLVRVDTDTRLAEVRIQGSDKPIYARYPENWEQTPVWLKPGNAVRITHTGGNRGRIELVGHGMLIPTAVSGGIITPVIPGLADTVVSGCLVKATTPAGMSVYVTSGTYRIDETLYTLGSLPLGIHLPLGIGIPLGGASTVLSIDAASATKFRYDIIVIGTDSAAEVIKGEEAASNPVMPVTPADHIKVGHILIYPNMTVIAQTDIGRYWTAPIASAVVFDIDDPDLEMYPEGSYIGSTDIDILIRDQYGNLFPKASPGHYVTIEFIRGNGTLTGEGKTFTDLDGPQGVYTLTGQLSFTYTREGYWSGGTYYDEGESSPILKASISTPLTIEGVGYIQLLDTSGYPK